MTMDGKMLAIIALVAIIAYLYFKPGMKSTFTMEGAPYESSVSGPSMGDSRPMDSSSTSLPAELLPKEVPVTEDFSQFSTDAILSSQNYLDPRNMIGYPETVGGTLRNANWQIRSEPPNPRDPVSIFNLSTIVPEQMRPMFEIQDGDYK